MEIWTDPDNRLCVSKYENGVRRPCGNVIHLGKAFKYEDFIDLEIKGEKCTIYLNGCKEEKDVISLNVNDRKLMIIKDELNLPLNIEFIDHGSNFQIKEMTLYE